MKIRYSDFEEFIKPGKAETNFFDVIVVIVAMSGIYKIVEAVIMYLSG